MRSAREKNPRTRHGEIIMSETSTFTNVVDAVRPPSAEVPEQVQRAHAETERPEGADEGWIQICCDHGNGD